VLAGLNLRIAVASVPPVIDELRDDLDLSSAAAGLLTSAPILCFGLLAPVAPLLARRLGAERVLLYALLPLAAGVLIRGESSAVALSPERSSPVRRLRSRTWSCRASSKAASRRTKVA
jgi:CP family cyanate transporter-like MFS transporter